MVCGAVRLFFGETIGGVAVFEYFFRIASSAGFPVFIYGYLSRERRAGRGKKTLDARRRSALPSEGAPTRTRPASRPLPPETPEHKPTAAP